MNEQIGGPPRKDPTGIERFGEDQRWTSVGPVLATHHRRAAFPSTLDEVPPHLQPPPVLVPSRSAGGGGVTPPPAANGNPLFKPLGRIALTPGKAAKGGQTPPNPQRKHLGQEKAKVVMSLMEGDYGTFRWVKRINTL